MLGAIQRIVSTAIWEQIITLVPPRIATPSDLGVPEEEAEEGAPVLVPPMAGRQGVPPLVRQEVPPQWLTYLEHLQKGLQDVWNQIERASEDEQQSVPFTKVVMADELSINCRTPTIAEYDGTTDPMEHLERFENAAILHRYTDGIKCRVFITTFARAALRKTELSLFAIQQKDNEPLKEYLERFNTAAIEVPSATQEVKASAFLQGLLDGDFLKPLAKKRVSKFDALLARAANYINMEVAQAAKKESRREKQKETKEEAPSKKSRVDVRDKKPPFQRVNTVYTPLTVLITQVLMAVEGNGLLSRPRSWKDSPQRPKSDKFCRFHNDYALLANYEVDRIFIDSRSSTDIPFEEAYDQIQLGDIPLEKVNTSLYGFAGEVVHHRGMISLPLTLGAGVARRTCMLKFLGVDVPSAYNVILGRPTLNAFQAVISTYHMKIKFPTPGGVGEV
ncbi:UNVERIFIED_CONTAM: hypothetical protein Slati_3477700 [Sesamum latifolium]|uniref:Retrotransposon gag domain-containing protein n=1 Tax=Sesamum latifolium TaxID=2727402 RepID=A0AAW2UH17_9LAMI